MKNTYRAGLLIAAAMLLSGCTATQSNLHLVDKTMAQQDLESVRSYSDEMAIATLEAIIAGYSERDDQRQAWAK